MEERNKGKWRIRKKRKKIAGMREDKGRGEKDDEEVDEERRMRK